MLLTSFDPPGYLDDFAQVPGMLAQWSAAVSGWVDGNIALAQRDLHAGDRVQFFNETELDL